MSDLPKKYLYQVKDIVAKIGIKQLSIINSSMLIILVFEEIF